MWDVFNDFSEIKAFVRQIISNIFYQHNLNHLQLLIKGAIDIMCLYFVDI